MGYGSILEAARHTEAAAKAVVGFLKSKGFTQEGRNYCKGNLMVAIEVGQVVVRVRLNDWKLECVGRCRLEHFANVTGLIRTALGAQYKVVEEAAVSTELPNQNIPLRRYVIVADVQQKSIAAVLGR